MDKLVKWLENLLRAQKKSRAWRTFVSCLAAIVVSTTTYSLILPAITVESSATDSVGGLVVQEADPGSTGTGAEASADVVTVEAENGTQEEAAVEEPSAVEAETASAEEAAPKSGTVQTAVSQTEYVETSGNTAAYEEVTKNNDNTYTFKVTGLPVVDGSGNALEYYVKEIAVDGYKEPVYGMSQTTAGTGTGTTTVVSKVTKTDRAEDKEYIINRPYDAVSLPSTGGPGTRLFFGSGIAFLAAAGILLFIRRKRIRDFSEGRW